MSRRLAVFCLSIVLGGAFVSRASAQVSCAGVPAFASCTAYASGASVVFANTKYTSIAPISNTRDCPPSSPYDPSSDNWWTSNGTCSGGGTATATATRTSTATATRTSTATATGPTATRTFTATATRTPTATATGSTATRTSTSTATRTSTATATRTPTATGTVSPTPTSSNSQPPPHLLIGYWHNFDNGTGFIKLRDVPTAWDIVHLAFGEPPGGTGSTIQFIPYSGTTDAELTSDVALLHSRGKKVCLSIGGQNGHVELKTTADRDAFVSSVTGIINKYGLDGLDIDFEGGSLYVSTGDTIANPVSPVQVNLISAIRTIRSNTRGSGFVLTMAPETFYVQMGYYTFGGNGGGYLPVINALRDILTVLHVQDYNSGPIMGLDDQWHTMPAIDFHVAMTDMVLTGYDCPKGSTNHFAPLRPDQYAIGLPAAVNAGNGYTSDADVHSIFNYLVRGTPAGSYKPHGTYPTLRGLMAWSINWDRFNNFDFSTSHRAYLDSLP